MANNEDSLIREVEEELRRERFASLWQRYGTYMIGAAVAFVVAVAGYKWNEQRAIAATQAAGARFEAAGNLVADGKLDDANKAFAEIGQDGPTGYASLAQLKAAGGLVAAGKPAEALPIFEALGNSANADPLLRDYARLQAASLRVGHADFTEMQNRLNDLSVEKAPWRFPARELLGIAALKAGRPAEARKALESMVADPTVPTALAERARLLMTRVVAAEQAVVVPSPTEPKK
jgi:hypothetical protein